MPKLGKSRLLGFIALFAMVAVGFVIALRGPQYYSSPTAKRVQDSPWLDPPDSSTPEAPDLLLREEIELKITENEIWIRAKRKLRTSNSAWPRVSTAVAPFGQAAVFADGTSIRPIAASYGYAIDSAEGDYLLETTEFDPLSGAITGPLKEFRPEIVKLVEFWPIRRIGSRALANLALIYELDGIPDAETVDRNWLWDHATGSILDRSLGAFEVKDQIFYDSFYLSALHPFSAVSSINLQHGPFEEYLLEPVSGATATSPHFQFIIHEVIPGRIAGRISSLDGPHLRLRENADERRNSSIFIASWSSPELLDWSEIEIVTHAGSIHTAQPFFPGSEEFAFFQAAVPKEQISKFRIRFRPFLKKAIFQLGPIPGTPTVNDDVRNLFDVVIPYHRELKRDSLLRLTQLSTADPFLPLTFDAISSTGRNVSVNELWVDCVSQSKEGRYLIDQDSHEVGYLPPRFQWLRDRIPSLKP
tara:strand:- start:16701 stop:18119 length:1419 start_codon:yes stop_codon:yes gene_type:complete